MADQDHNVHSHSLQSHDPLVAFIVGYLNFVGIHKELKEVEISQLFCLICVVGKLAFSEHNCGTINIGYSLVAIILWNGS